MSQRRRGEADNAPIYSEADVADFRERWEQAEKERQFGQQLAALNGRMDNIPKLIEATVRQILLEDSVQQRKEDETRRRSTLRFVVGVAAAVVVLVVPIETAVISHLYP